MQVCKMLIYKILAWPPSTFSFTFCEGFLGLFLFSSSAKHDKYMVTTNVVTIVRNDKIAIIESFIPNQ